MRLEETIYSNHKLVIEQGRPVAVQIDGEIAFCLNDTVQVTGDVRGYICPGISEPGVGKIVEIRRDNSDHFYGVQMETGEFGYMKHCRMKKVG